MIRFNVIEVVCGFDKNKAILGTVLLIPKAVLCLILLFSRLEE